MLYRKSCVLMTLVLVLILISIGFVWVLKDQYEVVQKGQLLSYTKGKIYEIRIFDRFTIFAEPEVKPSGDVLNAYFLIGISFVSLAFVIILWRLIGGAARDEIVFFICLYTGAGFLAADELFGLHETLGHNIQFLRGHFGIRRPDDAVILTYGLVGIIFLLNFRRVLSQSRRALVLFGIAITLFVLAAIGDFLVIRAEEILELISSLCIFSGVIVLGVHILEAKLSSFRQSRY